MKRVYELEVYKLAEELSDLVWYDTSGTKRFKTQLVIRLYNQLIV